MNEAVLATANDYEGLQRAMRVRAEALNISRETLGEISGLHSGHAGKMLADPPSKNMGIVSMGLLLQALGLKLLIVEDAEQMRRLANQMTQRAGGKGWKKAILNGVENGTVMLKFSRRHMRKLGLSSAAGRMKKIPAWRRRQIARKASRARWQKAV